MTTPTGRLAWGQAGVYDAIDDRAVIAAVTGYRTGLVRPVQVTAGSGLNVVIAGGWLGVADCGDQTSAVVGSLIESAVQAIPGPPAGERVDYVWCDVEPDDGLWLLSVIPAAEAAGRPGIPVATIIVPANAALAAQMDIRPAGAMLERRLAGYAAASETNVRVGGTWQSVGNCITAVARAEPGRWYRVRFTANSPMITSGGQSLRIGVGYRAAGSIDTSSVLQRGAVLATVANNTAQAVALDWVFQHPPGAAPADRNYDGRIWIAGTGGQFRTCAVLDLGDPLTLTVEDLGS